MVPDPSMGDDVLALMHKNVMLDKESIEPMHGRFMGVSTHVIVCKIKHEYEQQQYV